MELLLELCLLFALCLVGQVVSSILPFPLPSSVTAMVLLLLLLRLRAVKLEKIERSTSFLLKYLALFLVPAGVSLMEEAGLLSSVLWQLLLICLVTTPLTLLTAYYAAHGLAVLLERRRSRHA